MLYLKEDGTFGDTHESYEEHRQGVIDNAIDSFGDSNEYNDWFKEGVRYNKNTNPFAENIADTLFEYINRDLLEDNQVELTDLEQEEIVQDFDRQWEYRKDQDFDDALEFVFGD